MSTAQEATERYPHLDALESQSIYILREAFHHFERLGFLWSIGKDSCALLHLVRKAFFGRVPFPLVHVDTSFKPPEMIAFRDRLVRDWNLDLRVGSNQAALAAGETFPSGRLTRVECCAKLKTEALQATLAQHGFNAVIVGIRRDEEGTRAKERYFSPRGGNFTWNFKDQPPEFWGQFQTDFGADAHVRVHPLLHWTELNIWEYIDREKIPIVDLYFSKNGRRHRSLGCAPCTGTVESTASNVAEIIEELRHTKLSERSTRAQDGESEDAFEKLRAAGYM
jgi:sulfate adenylyltransferase subunit 2